MTTTRRQALELLAERVRDSRYIPIEPHAKQWRFLLSMDREVMYGGAAGGGKSAALLAGALMFVDLPRYNALILRTSYQDLSQADGLIPESKKWLMQTDAEWNGTDKRWTFPSGATLSFGYLSSENDRYRYGSSQYQFIAFDELTEFRLEDYTFLFSRLRKTRDNPAPLRMRSATNPVGRGLRWVRERFLDSDRPFIQAGIDDNPHIDSEEYLQSLEHLSPQMKAKLRDGVWEDLSGGELFDRADVVPVDQAPAKVEKVVRFWDFAATEPGPSNRDPDWLAGVKMARCADGSFGVMDVRRRRVGPDRVEQIIRRTAQEDGRDVPVVLEVEGGSQAKIAVDYIATQVLPGWSVHTQKVSRGKEDRAQPLASQVRQGNLWARRSQWLDDYLAELHDFPGGAHDDQVDASTGAFNWLVGNRRKVGGGLSVGTVNIG